MPDAEAIAEACKVLQIGDTGSLEEIRKAYYALSLKFHPDRHPESKKKHYENKFDQIHNAYATLVDYVIHLPVSFAKKDVDAVDLGKREQGDLKKYYKNWFI